MFIYLRILLRPLAYFYFRIRGILRLKWAVRKGNCKIVIGASHIYENGWTPTEMNFLNLLHSEDWDRFFKTDSISAILSEHVWEHLNPEDAIIAARNCYKYLKPGGYLRLAVPDGNHFTQEYIEMVRPGGSGSGSDDHKVLYTIGSVKELFTSVGFRVEGLEYFDEQNVFQFSDWDIAQGKINRSKRFDSRNSQGELKYTSLIIDAIKE
jgi:predicted SAM-dependent methyltransferase